jgi:hypothetical protein
LLAIGFICNWLIKPVADKHFMTDAELEAERKLAHEAAVKAADSGVKRLSDEVTSPLLVVGAWLFVGVPILWGVWVTLDKASVLFK